MSQAKNKYGLSRYIPDPIKREVRQKCGFGCVKCGMAVYEYEHLDPEFSEAKEHNPDGIVLLCGSCHSLKTRKMLSAATIKKAAKTPFCKREGFSSAYFDISSSHPEIRLGTLSCIDVKSLISIDGESIFSIDPPEELGAPFRINAFLANKAGEEILRIENNEWKTTALNWDVEVKGPRITIRNSKGDIALIIRVETPKLLVVERLEMMHRGIRIKCSENHDLEITTQCGTKLRSARMNIVGCAVGIDISSKGLMIGVGGGSMYIESLQIAQQSPTRRGSEILYNKHKNHIGRNDQL